MSHYDAIIIGTGQAGPSLARALAGAGWRTAIIERGKFGGTCINTGCTPTKTLVASAYAAYLARRGPEYGVLTGDVRIDMKQVKARKDAVSAVSRDAIKASLRNTANLTVYQGHARLEAANKVSAGGAELTAERIFLNVGARPSVPSIPGLSDVPYLTSSTILDLDSVPPHLLVIGGSYVGLEFAQIYRRFGAEVTIIEAMPRLIAREDAEISDAVRAFLEAEGIVVRAGAKLREVAGDGNEIIVSGEDGAGSWRIAGSHVLVATGRRPNTDDLGLDRAGLATDPRGYIAVDDQLRTNVKNIWALGECNGRGAFTHTAYNDFEIVAGNLLSNSGRSLSDRITAYALFTDPPLGRAGMTEAEARAKGHSVLVGSIPMENVSRAYEKGETQGLMKLVVDRDNEQFLGAAILGTTGDEVVHCILDLMYAKASYKLLQRAMHIHPTVAEFLPVVVEELVPAETYTDGRLS